MLNAIEHAPTGPGICQADTISRLTVAILKAGPYTTCEDEDDDDAILDYPFTKVESVVDIWRKLKEQGVPRDWLREQTDCAYQIVEVMEETLV